MGRMRMIGGPQAIKFQNRLQNPQIHMLPSEDQMKEVRLVQLPPEGSFCRKGEPAVSEGD
jgi:hypothetical protein